MNEVFAGNCKSTIPLFIEWKKASGISYRSEMQILKQFDKFSQNFLLEENTLPKNVVLEWATKRPHESVKTLKSRVLVVKHFCQYLVNHNYAAFVPNAIIRYTSSNNNFVPHIYSANELKAFFHAADNMEQKACSPNAYLVYPLLFRMLCTCGMRLSEALQLKVSNVDTDVAQLTILNTKFGKSRLVAMSDDLNNDCKNYLKKIPRLRPIDFFFQSPSGGAYCKKTVGKVFRALLWDARISHGGRGKGPRIHDFRHTFAVTCLNKWHLEKQDLSSMLPVLAAYLGHADLRGTQNYLRLTFEMHATIVKQFEGKYKNIIPQGGTSNG